MDKIIIYNPRHGGKINDVFAKTPYIHEVNTIKKYDRVLGEYLLKKYLFLQKVEPKDVPEIVKKINAKFKCEFEGCDYVTDTEQKLKAHILGKHKMTKEVEDALSQIEEAAPVGMYQEPKGEVDPEQAEGIPNTSKGDVDNWYGEGLTADKVGSGMMVRKQPGVTPGHFN